uniref:Large ribosomal subunit protein uL24c n=1 Tax=Balbiania investiens TaxID=111861 RepID=A0A4D6BKY0_9FLOR|nr:ribosomal protein L24 [Balbiania investiens]QBX88612.1 ribosomal protein L24 [Balbiania investiens]
MHVKKGDQVKIITGAYKGQIGEIMQVLRRTQEVLIKNINVKTKHGRPTKEGEVGQVLRVEAPIHSSNVMLYDIHRKVASRYKHIKDEHGQKRRVLIKLNKAY